MVNLMDSAISQASLEEIISVLQKNGNSWPPFPEGFKVPNIIKSMWIHKNYRCLGSVTRMPILRGGITYGGIREGDVFNGVVLPRKRKKDVNFPNRHHRTPQFIFDGLSGMIIFDKSLSGSEIIEKGKVRAGEVHRFEIVSVLPKKFIFYCVPLKHVFNKENLRYNLLNCNYDGR